MIKKIVQILCLIFISSNTFVGANYPDKINNDQAFATLSDFENIYQKIHDDILRIDEALIIARTCQHESIDCTFVPDESQQNFANFTDYFRRQNTSFRQADQSNNLINGVLRFELETARQEQTWSRSLKLSNIFADTDTTNAPFEIHAILESIQRQLIGDKTKVFTPKFINDQIIDDDATNNGFVIEPEPWQDQRNAEVTSTKYTENEKKSLGGLTDNSQESLSKNEGLITATNKVAQNIWDTWFSTTALGFSRCPALDMSVDQPIVSTDEPLIHQETDKQILAELQGKLESYVNKTDCFLSAETEPNNDTNIKNTATLQTKQQKLQQCESVRQQEIEIAMKNFKKNQIKTRLKQEYESIQYGLDYFESFAQTLQDSFRKKIKLFECYLNHPSK